MNETENQIKTEKGLGVSIAPRIIEVWGFQSPPEPEGVVH